MLARATELSVRAQGFQIKSAFELGRESKTAAKVGERLARSLDKVFRLGKPNVKNAPSIRITAPDTGGRSFHFAHSTISVRDIPGGGLSRFLKDGGKAELNGGVADLTKGGERRRRKPQATRGSAHMEYIEREDAVERGSPSTASARDIREDYLTDALTETERHPNTHHHETVEPPVAKSRSGIPPADPLENPDARRRKTSSERVLDRELGVGRLNNSLRPKAMQKYAERDGAIEKATPTFADAAPDFLFSFGTIGETREERLAFWDLVETHAERSNAVLQHRLIVELPHEVAPETRLAIVKSFTKRFEDQSIPYWAVLHAPTEKNDARNYHAHIVFLTRPAKIIMHPEGGIDDGELVDGKPRTLVPTWDFAARSYLRDRHGHRNLSYPHRQKSTQRGHFIGEERHRFAEVVNAELAKAGCTIRYDPRSYKDMGLPVEAMDSLSQKVSDQTRKGHRTTKAPGFTQRVRYADLQRAARQKADAMASITALEAALPSRRLTAKSVLARVREFKLRDYRFLSMAKREPEKILELKRKMLAVEKRQLVAAVNGEVERVQMERVVLSTDLAFFEKLHRNVAVKSKASTAGATGSDDATASFAADQHDALPDLLDVKVLNKAASEELSAIIKDNEAEDRRFRLMLGGLRSSMQQLRTTISPMFSVQGQGNAIEPPISRPLAEEAERDERRVEMLARQRDRQREDAEAVLKPKKRLKYFVDDPFYVPPAGPYPIPTLRPTSQFMYDLQAALMAARDPKDVNGSIDRWLKATIRSISESNKAAQAARAAKTSHPDGQSNTPSSVPPSETATRADTGPKAGRADEVSPSHPPSSAGMSELRHGGASDHDVAAPVPRETVELPPEHIGAETAAGINVSRPASLSSEAVIPPSIGTRPTHPQPSLEPTRAATAAAEPGERVLPRAPTGGKAVPAKGRDVGAAGLDGPSRAPMMSTPSIDGNNPDDKRVEGQAAESAVQPATTDDTTRARRKRRKAILSKKARGMGR